MTPKTRDLTIIDLVMKITNEQTKHVLSFWCIHKNFEIKSSSALFKIFQMKRNQGPCPCPRHHVGFSASSSFTIKRHQQTGVGKKMGSVYYYDLNNILYFQENSQ